MPALRTVMNRPNEYQRLIWQGKNEDLELLLHFIHSTLKFVEWRTFVLTSEGIVDVNSRKHTLVCKIKRKLTRWLDDINFIFWW